MLILGYEGTINYVTIKAISVRVRPEHPSVEVSVYVLYYGTSLVQSRLRGNFQLCHDYSDQCTSTTITPKRRTISVRAQPEHPSVEVSVYVLYYGTSLVQSRLRGNYQLCHDCSDQCTSTTRTPKCRRKCVRTVLRYKSSPVSATRELSIMSRLQRSVYEHDQNTQVPGAVQFQR
ncbi:hypothetical protein J6590_039936 [Homalodisca vitripennis]|nr:hypothetical protein J6590_039936 [Homalodisca vitripennis]